MPRNDSANLDLLRAVAVLLVVSAHLLLYIGRVDLDKFSGLTGVNMFFVHTCLVLMWSLERDSDVARFYVRRAFRIYPLWLVVLTLTVLVRLPMAPVFAPAFRFDRPSGLEFLANAALLVNLWHNPRTVGASWSLFIEVQMYLFLPALFFFARSLKSVWPLVVLDLFIVFYLLRTEPNSGFDLLTAIPSFLPGIIAYVLWKGRRVGTLPAWLFPVFLLVIISLDHTFGAVHRAWVFCLVLAFALPMFRDITYRPLVRAAHQVAKYSYGIYLGHIAAICVAVHILAGHSFAVRAAAMVAMLVALPVAFYHGVEYPMIRLGTRVAKRVGYGREPAFSKASLEMEPAP